MSTRGIYGFRKNGTDKLTYNHSDSYPDWLGAKMVEFCAATGIAELNGVYDRIELVNEDEQPTPEQIIDCIAFADTSVGTGRLNDWYCLLRDLQGYPQKWLNIDGKIYMTDDAAFITDSLFCEYGYIVNLDTNKLEFWVGFQKSPDDTNRYGNQPNEDGYYPCRLVKEYSIRNLRAEKADSIVADMNKRVK